ncbi:hypothetical protein [Bacillus sp. FSL R7-0177]|uniref:hypothetical protein n=1 Tax=Bacillus sp. FSL R7-0177 TaxID=2921671 RepID=UPI0030FCDF5B
MSFDEVSFRQKTVSSFRQKTVEILRDDLSVNRWLALELEKLVEINKTPHSAKWQTTPPFCLFNYDGKIINLSR